MATECGSLKGGRRSLRSSQLMRKEQGCDVSAAKALLLVDLATCQCGVNKDSRISPPLKESTIPAFWVKNCSELYLRQVLSARRR